MRPGFDPWVRKIPWRRKWPPTLVFLAGEFHGQKSLAGKESQRDGHDWVTHTHTQIFIPEVQAPSPPFSSIQSLSCVRFFATPWIAAHQASLSITNSRSSLKLTSIESVMPSSHLRDSLHARFMKPIYIRHLDKDSLGDKTQWLAINKENKSITLLGRKECRTSKWHQENGLCLFPTNWQPHSLQREPACSPMQPVR